MGISDIKNLFKVIMTYKKLVSNNVGIDGNLINGTYPFEAFYGILDYYKKFGLYREKEKVTKPGYASGKSHGEILLGNQQRFLIIIIFSFFHYR
ncbi:MAG: hypothetical protein ACLUCE_00035 [Streptococcus sp.]|uniref:hypothetical protein n=1 Tax=Streptococcus sp. TaxID=1306 RepID=UPI003994D03E